MTIVRNLGCRRYESVWKAMSHYTDIRNQESADEIWCVEHEPVFTQGQAGKAEHLLNTGDIPVVQVDRGGQVTYHGPGQLVVYPLLDLRRAKIGVRELVTALETATVAMLKGFGIAAAPRADAPGVYLSEGPRTGNKIASIGLRVRRGCSFHGIAINIDMDLAPFLRINPCGYAGMQMVQMAELVQPVPEWRQVAEIFVGELLSILSLPPADWQPLDEDTFAHLSASVQATENQETTNG
ncbi:lipoyl(octanoyl) transferase LipB [Microbulbifer thermotolerans]|uniref:lipoyl(octanoyl) transferase LipB n=1 Tax=Microbulbifer thermotolerans TaxID=252514 RepID=UPI00224B3662|nr:lipoyl(octanoyl) transferase LipB [Microbulbifer thermotolerans]MCX2781713.1 lipoyl(octanoyl) transferase LipB [Microbulbifer thermotolerans]